MEEADSLDIEDFADLEDGPRHGRLPDVVVFAVRAENVRRLVEAGFMRVEISNGRETRWRIGEGLHTTVIREEVVGSGVLEDQVVVVQVDEFFGQSWDTVKVELEKESIACWNGFFGEDVILVDNLDPRVTGVEPIRSLAWGDNVNVAREPLKMMLDRAKGVTKLVEVIVVSGFLVEGAKLLLECEMVWIRAIDPGARLVDERTDGDGSILPCVDNVNLLFIRLEFNRVQRFQMHDRCGLDRGRSCLHDALRKQSLERREGHIEDDICCIRSIVDVVVGGRRKPGGTRGALQLLQLLRHEL